MPHQKHDKANCDCFLPHDFLDMATLRTTWNKGPIGFMISSLSVKDHKSVVRNLMGFHNFSEIMSEYSIGKGFRGYSSRMTDK